MGIIWSLVSYFKDDPSAKGFKTFFSIGFKTFIVVTLFMVIYTLIFFSFHTEYRDAKIAENSRMILLQGNHLPSEIEENANKFKKIFIPVMVFTAVFIYLFLGALITAVTSAFLLQKHNLAAHK